MFVVEVWTLRVPSKRSVSAGSPLSSSVMAANDCHVAAP